jgi:hypothetical protein
MLESAGGRSWVKHYMFDFGSILGSGTVFAQRHRSGNEYIFEQKPGWLSLATFGLYIRPWMTVDYPRVPRSIGRIEADRFDPLNWKPEYPNSAFDNMRPDDAFWAARIVSKFSDESIRAVVEKAKYSDPAATEFLTRTLITRRDKVVAAWINQVCPVVEPRLLPDGTFTFVNAAIEAHAADAPTQYELQWFRFDNATNQRAPLGQAEAVSTAAGRAPAELLTSGDYVGVTVTAKHERHPGWTNPASFYFRASGQGSTRDWQLVGTERWRDTVAPPLR